MTTSREYTDVNIAIPDAFNAYMQLNCPFYSGYQYNSNTDVIVFLSEDINEARGQAMDALIAAYVDPPVYYSWNYDKTALTPSEIIVDGTDSGLFTAMTSIKALNNLDGSVINDLKVTIQALQIEGPSTNSALITLKLRDLTNQVDMATVSQTPTGVLASDGSCVFDVVLSNLSQFMPPVMSVWEISAAIQGNVSVKVAVVQFQYFSEETASNP